MSHSAEHEPLILHIFSQIAYDNNLSVERVKRLLLIKKNPHINQQFWEILDSLLPFHGFNHVGCCKDCGSLHLVKSSSQ